MTRTYRIFAIAPTGSTHLEGLGRDEAIAIADLFVRQHASATATVDCECSGQSVYATSSPRSTRAGEFRKATRPNPFENHRSDHTASRPSRSER